VTFFARAKKVTKENTSEQSLPWEELHRISVSRRIGQYNPVVPSRRALSFGDRQAKRKSFQFAVGELYLETSFPCRICVQVLFSKLLIWI